LSTNVHTAKRYTDTRLQRRKFGLRISVFGGWCKNWLANRALHWSAPDHPTCSRTLSDLAKRKKPQVNILSVSQALSGEFALLLNGTLNGALHRQIIIFPGCTNISGCTKIILTERKKKTFEATRK
jgi:hypothetical protein